MLLTKNYYVLGASVDAYAATVSAGSTRAACIFIADNNNDFTGNEESSLQRLTAGLTRTKGPLIVAAPQHSWGLLAAAELLAGLEHGTSHSAARGRYGAPCPGVWAFGL